MENVGAGGAGRAAILSGGMMTVCIPLVLAMPELFRRKLVWATNSWGIEFLLGFFCLCFFLCKHSSMQELCS